jgi:Ca-activated chloride channel family protein
MTGRVRTRKDAVQGDRQRDADAVERAYRLMHVGIKGYDVQADRAPKANLVFLIDVSGSMDEPDKLPLLKSRLPAAGQQAEGRRHRLHRHLCRQCRHGAGADRVQGEGQDLSAIDTLQPGGSTAGEAGMEAAYNLAQQSFVKDGINRVMLATDGDFNVGRSSDDDLKTDDRKAEAQDRYLPVGARLRPRQSTTTS